MSVFCGNTTFWPRAMKCEYTDRLAPYAPMAMPKDCDLIAKLRAIPTNLNPAAPPPTPGCDRPASSGSLGCRMAVVARASERAVERYLVLGVEASAPPSESSFT